VKGDLVGAEEVLREELRVEASPALLERVRQAALSAPPRGPSLRRLAFAGGTIALAAAWMISSARLLTPPSPSGGAGGPGAVGSPPSASLVPPPGSPPTVTWGRPSMPPKPRARPVPLPTAEIVVDPRQEEALLRLVALASGGQVVPLDAPDGREGGRADSAALAALGLSPLAIPPLESPDLADLTPAGRGDS
jgi:hypothetical protein